MLNEQIVAALAAQRRNEMMREAAVDRLARSLAPRKAGSARAALSEVGSRLHALLRRSALRPGSRVAARAEA